MQSDQLFKILSDKTRLDCLLLIQQHEELCVCELVEALQLSQPKVSRHLARLRHEGLVIDDRRGAWVYYRLSDQLPPWVYQIVAATIQAEQAHLMKLNFHLDSQSDRCDDKTPK